MQTRHQQTRTVGRPGCELPRSRTGARSGSAEAAARRPTSACQRVPGHGELLRLAAGGADLEPEVNLPELRPGADQPVTLEPFQRREDVNRAGLLVVIQAEDYLPAAVLVDGERLPADRRGPDLPRSAVAPARVVHPDHDLVRPGGVPQPQVLGCLALVAGLR